MATIKGYNAWLVLFLLALVIFPAYFAVLGWAIMLGVQVLADSGIISGSLSYWSAVGLGVLVYSIVKVLFGNYTVAS
jgi:hypothetical protein